MTEHMRGNVDTGLFPQLRSVYKELHADHGNGLLTTRRRYGSGEGHNAVLRWVSKGACPLAHDFAKQSVVCYTLCRRCRENAVAAGEGKGISSGRKQGCDCMA